MRYALALTASLVGWSPLVRRILMASIRPISTVVLVLACVFSAPSAKSEDVRHAVEAGNRVFIATLLRGDATAVANLYTEDAQVMAPVLERLFESSRLAYVETVRQGAQREVVYSVSAKPDVTDREVIDAVVAINDNLKVTYRTVRHAVDVP